MNKNDLFLIRDYKPEDEVFIYATWLRGLYYGDSWFTAINKDTFMKEYKKIIYNILQNPNIVIRVACLKDDADVILGYSVVNKSETVLHWCFVKTAWRKIGLAKSLVPSTVKDSTVATKLGMIILKKKNIEFNPFVI